MSGLKDKRVSKLNNLYKKSAFGHNPLKEKVEELSYKVSKGLLRVEDALYLAAQYGIDCGWWMNQEQDRINE